MPSMMYFFLSLGSIRTAGNVRAVQLLILLNFPIDHFDRSPALRTSGEFR